MAIPKKKKQVGSANRHICIRNSLHQAYKISYLTFN
jgi:hypothetical protein